MVEPEVMVRYRHLVEGDLLRVLEEAVRPPDIVQPVHVQYSVLFGHVLREPEPRVPPALRQKYVRDVRLPNKTPTNNHQPCDRKLRSPFEPRRQPILITAKTKNHRGRVTTLIDFTCNYPTAV